MKGKNFENRMRQSWAMVPDVWRRRLTDGRGRGDQPADDFVLYRENAFLCEYKTTEKKKFQLNEIRPNQFAALKQFNNEKFNRFSMLFIELQDSCFVVMFRDLLAYVYQHRVMSLSKEELETVGIQLKSHDGIYDLSTYFTHNFKKNIQ